MVINSDQSSVEIFYNWVQSKKDLITQGSNDGNMISKWVNSSYPHLLRFAAKLEDDEDGTNVIGLAQAVYGWMPTMLKQVKLDSFGTEKSNIFARIRGITSFGDAIRFLERSEDQGSKQPPINNSWVGTSKFLHFVNPNFFPIWDSRIARQFGLKHKYQIEKIENYIDYIKFVEQATNHPNCEELREEFRDQFEFVGRSDLSKSRVVEYLLYMGSIKGCGINW